MNIRIKTMFLFLTPVLVLGLSACFDNKTNIPFVVSEYNNPKPKSGFETLTPPKNFYSINNFIIDSSGQVYYYQFMLGKTGLCGTGLPNHPDNIPEFASLSPERLIAIPSNAVDNFISLNVKSECGIKKFITISSMTDTIRSIGFDNIFRVVSDTSNHIGFSIRMTTIEENTVLRFKKNNEFYDPKKVVWDTTQIFIYPDFRDGFSFNQKSINPQSKIANPK